MVTGAMNPEIEGRYFFIYYLFSFNIVNGEKLDRKSGFSA